MTTLNDIYPTDDVDDVLDTWVRELMGSTLRSEFKNVETLSATRVLLDADTPIQRFNCNGADRIVKMPTADAVNNHPYLVVNSTSSGLWTLTAQNNAGTETLITLSPNQAALMLPDGNGAYILITPKRETEYKITPTVASNNLTVTITHADGSTPSTTRPLWFLINNTWRAVTAALYITVNSGTSTFSAGSDELKTKEIDYFPMVTWVAASSLVAIGFARFAGSLGGDFHATATNERYAAWAKNNNQAVTVASSDVVQVIGRFAATLSAAAGNWSVPTYTNDNLIQFPIKTTRRLEWTPQHSRTITGYTNLPTTNSAYYLIDDRKIMFFTKHTQHGTPGGSGYQRYTGPFSNSLDTQICVASNNAAATSLTGYWISGSSYITFYKYDGSVDVTASNSYSVEGEFFLR